jgi:hypothetical protein
VRLREEDRARTEVVTADFRQVERFRHAHVGVADDGHVVAVGLDRRQRVVGHECEISAGLLRREQVFRGAPVVTARQTVDFLHAHESGVFGRSRLHATPESRRHHRVQEWQRHRGSHTAEERSAGHVLSSDEVHRPALLVNADAAVRALVLRAPYSTASLRSSVLT